MVSVDLADAVIPATGVGKETTIEQLDAILRSRRYQLAQHIADVCHWLRSAF
jgi:hypothetical protein